MVNNQMEIMSWKIHKWKSSLEGLDNRFELSEERMSELENRLIEIMHSEEQSEGMKKSEWTLREI